MRKPVRPRSKPCSHPKFKCSLCAHRAACAARLQAEMRAADPDAPAWTGRAVIADRKRACSLFVQAVEIRRGRIATPRRW